MKTLYIVAFSYDWEEGFVSFTSEPKLVSWLREQFELDDEIPAWSDRFWRDLNSEYNEGDWKSCQILKVTDGRVTAINPSTKQAAA